MKSSAKHFGVVVGP